MRFDYFEKLTLKKANAFLQRFLDTESSHIKETAKRCARTGVKMDYSIKSLSPFIRWIVKKLHVIRLDPDPTVPEWVRRTESYTKHLFEFDTPSKELVLQTGYYLGESFVRSYSNLQWGTGDTKTSDANMPVVAGFKYDLEMPPILVADNLLGAVIADPDEMGAIEIMIHEWNKNA